MNKLTLLVPLMAASAFSQTAPADNPMSTWLRGAYMGNRNNIIRTAEKMPEENYGMRPGTQMEVRTFGQQVSHSTIFNFRWCSQAKGEKNPAPTDLDKMTAKADIMKALNDSFTYCDGVYNALTDASGSEIVEVTQENGRQTRNLRLGLLTQNYGHNNEIYGILVVYLRMKNIVPPASEPRPPAAAKGKQ